MPFDGTDFADAAILRTARDGIAVRERWTQGRLSVTQVLGGRAHCAMGWIAEAGASSAADNERIMTRYLFPELPWHRRMGLGWPPMAVVEFNDAPWRRHATVVRLFDRALARLNPQGA
jgi:hypothetical protein